MGCITRPQCAIARPSSRGRPTTGIGPSGPVTGHGFPRDGVLASCTSPTWANVLSAVSPAACCPPWWRGLSLLRPGDSQLGCGAGECCGGPVAGVDCWYCGELPGLLRVPSSAGPGCCQRPGAEGCWPGSPAAAGPLTGE